MKKISIVTLALLFCTLLHAQELYVATEPASNMPRGSLAARINSNIYKMPGSTGPAYRFGPELMIGMSKKWMIHLNGYASNVYQPALKWEGESIYSKFRFLSLDEVHSHFRMAAFGKLAFNNNPATLQMQELMYVNENGQEVPHLMTHDYLSDEISLDGNNSGWETGVVATQLIHKLALSSTVAYLHRMNYPGVDKAPGQSSRALDYTFSAGLLVLPVTYRDYRQTNLNLYCELLGSSSLDKKAYFVDIAPAVQFIFNSISRLDLSYRAQLIGNMQRLSTEQWVVRLEYNFLNFFNKN